MAASPPPGTGPATRPSNTSNTSNVSNPPGAPGTPGAPGVSREAGTGPAAGLVHAQRAGRRPGVRRRPGGRPVRRAAAETLARNGPNELPQEEPPPGWRRFLNQYRSYMQLILLGAAVVSMAVQEWSTAILLIVLTLVNAVIGLRQEGKAESAMNALKSMMKVTARVRRDGAATEVPAEEVVPGDIVLISAGDQVPADGRILEASALQIDESALTGESTPAAKQADALPAGGALSPGDQVNMAFMNTPVTHGSGVMLVTGTGGDSELGKISGLLSARPRSSRR